MATAFKPIKWTLTMSLANQAQLSVKLYLQWSFSVFTAMRLDFLKNLPPDFLGCFGSGISCGYVSRLSSYVHSLCLCCLISVLSVFCSFVLFRFIIVLPRVFGAAFTSCRSLFARVSVPWLCSPVLCYPHPSCVCVCVGLSVARASFHGCSTSAFDLCNIGNVIFCS